MTRAAGQMTIAKCAGWMVMNVVRMKRVCACVMQDQGRNSDVGRKGAIELPEDRFSDDGAAWGAVS